MVKVSIQMDFSKYNITEEQSKKIITRTLDLTTADLISNLRKESPVDTGALQGSWMQFKTGEFTREVKSSKKYADYVDKGTGLYGPRKKLITPKKKGGVLFFKVGGEKVFVKSSEGIKPRHFVRKSIRATKSRINDFAIKAIMES